MNICPRMVCNYCSAACPHCPYGKVTSSKEDYIPLANTNINEISILTGGEPLESPALRLWVDRSISHRVPFRIATGGHVSVRFWLAQLRLEPLFLGFNMGTDVLLTGDTHHKQVWRSNWHLLSKISNTWITITVGEHLCTEDALKLVADLCPGTVMLNAVEGSNTLWTETIEVLRKLKQVDVVEGFPG